jgi:hypothetical protein
MFLIKFVLSDGYYCAKFKNLFLIMLLILPIQKGAWPAVVMVLYMSGNLKL